MVTIDSSLLIGVFDCEEIPTIACSLFVKPDLTWTGNILGKKLPKSPLPLLSDTIITVPSVLNSLATLKLLSAGDIACAAL